MIKIAADENFLPSAGLATPAPKLEPSTKLDPRPEAPQVLEGPFIPGRAVGPCGWPAGPLIIRVCDWCQTVLGWKQKESLKRTMVSHGLCPECSGDHKEAA